MPDAPEFDVQNQTAEAQNQQFGYNSDFIGTVPHPEAPDDPDRLLLVNHHEYTNEELMFPGIGIQDDVGVRGHDRGARQHREGGPRRQRRRDPPRRRRQMVGRARLAATTAASPPRRRCGSRVPPRATRRCRPTPTRRGGGARHVQQLRGRHHALGHVADGRGELPRLLLVRPGGGRGGGDRRRSRRASSRRATACPASGTPGAGSTAASTWTRSRTSRTATAGSSR